MMLETDVMIVGGGPAGLATALAARRKGLQATVADCAQPPIDKACGEGLLPDGLAILESLGVRLNAGDAFPFTGIRFLEAGRSVEASFPAGPALGVRRTTLHLRMVEVAAQAGVRLLWGAAVNAFRPDGMTVGDTLVRARWIVGGDGGQSRIRAWAGLEATTRLRRRYGFRRHYRTGAWTDRMEVYWADGLQVYMTPVRADEACVVAISDNPHLRLEEALQRTPDIAARLCHAEIVTTERGSVSASCRLRRVARGNIALVGDASGSVDAITGAGLTLAFRQALALADALATGDLTRYEAAHRRILRRAEWMADLLLWMGRRRRLRRPALHLLAGHPAVFSKLLARHVGGTALPAGPLKDVWNES